MPFRRFSLGDYELIAIQAQPIRTIEAAMLFPDVPESEFQEEFERNPQYFAGSAKELRFGQTICALQGHGQTILVDTGMPLDNPVSTLIPGLREAGIEPDNVDLVILTHRDLDHVGGNLNDGRLTFPNATYVMGNREYEDCKVDTVRENYPPYFRPLEAVGALDVVADDAEVAPGIRLWLTPGHRSGVTSVLVDDKALLAADVWHCPLQVWHPDWKIKFDGDPELAVQTRKNVIREAAAKGWLVAVPHSPDFGIGRVIQSEDRLDWLPASD